MTNKHQSKKKAHPGQKLEPLPHKAKSKGHHQTSHASKSLETLYPYHSDPNRMPINPNAQTQVHAQPHGKLQPLHNSLKHDKKEDKHAKQHAKAHETKHHAVLVHENHNKNGKKDHHQSQPIHSNHQDKHHQQQQKHNQKHMAQSHQTLPTFAKNAQKTHTHQTERGQKVHPPVQIYKAPPRYEQERIEHEPQQTHSKFNQKQVQVYQSKSTKEEAAMNQRIYHYKPLKNNAQPEENKPQLELEIKTAKNGQLPKLAVYHILNKNPRNLPIAYTIITTYDETKMPIPQEIIKRSRVLKTPVKHGNSQEEIKLGPKQKLRPLPEPVKVASAPIVAKNVDSTKKRRKSADTGSPSQSEEHRHERFKIRKRPPMFLRHYPIIYRNMFRPGKNKTTDDTGFIIIADSEDTAERSFLNKYLNTQRVETVKKTIAFGAWGDFEVDGEAKNILPPNQNKLEDPLLLNSQAEQPAETTGPVAGGNKQQEIVPMPDKLKPEEAYQALLNWATINQKNRKVGTNCAVKQIMMYHGLDYTLETFCEKRSIVCSYKPYKTDEPYDELVKGPVIDPWTIECHPRQNFVEETQVIELAQTDVIESCFMCSGMQWLKCKVCKGICTVTCPTCQGKKSSQVVENGQKFYETCKACSAKGIVGCSHCLAKGRVVCNVCLGNEMVRYYLQLVVTYINHVDKHVGQRSIIPSNLRGRLTGAVVFQEANYQLKPISVKENPDIYETSQQLIHNSVEAHKTENRVIQQHTLSGYTCFKCDARYLNTHSFSFWVFDKDRKVICTEFPDFE